MTEPRNRLLWYATGEDAYFITYNVLVLLRSLGYIAGREFKDHRKLAFLVDFISDPNLVRIVTRRSPTAPMSVRDRAMLSAAFMRGVQRLPLVSRLVIALGRRGLLRISGNRGSTALNVSIDLNDDAQKFLRKRMFEQERSNIKELRWLRIGLLTYDSLLDRLFHEHGVARWGA